MDDERAALLLNTIITRTDQGKIPWSETTNADVFEAPFPSESLRIERELERDFDGEESAVFTITILNKDARVVDTIEPYKVRKYFRNPGEVFSVLFSKARGKALNVDKTVNTLLLELGGAIPIEEQDSGEVPF